MSIFERAFDRELRQILGLESEATTAAEPSKELALTLEAVQQKLAELHERWPREMLEVRLCAALRRHPIEVTRRVLCLVENEVVTWRESPQDSIGGLPDAKEADK